MARRVIPPGHHLPSEQTVSMDRSAIVEAHAGLFANNSIFDQGVPRRNFRARISPWACSEACAQDATSVAKSLGARYKTIATLTNASDTPTDWALTLSKLLFYSVLFCVSLIKTNCIKNHEKSWKPGIPLTAQITAPAASFATS